MKYGIMKNLHRSGKKWNQYKRSQDRRSNRLQRLARYQLTINAKDSIMLEIFNTIQSYKKSEKNRPISHHNVLARNRYSVVT